MSVYMAPCDWCKRLEEPRWLWSGLCPDCWNDHMLDIEAAFTAAGIPARTVIATEWPQECSACGHTSDGIGDLCTRCDDTIHR